MPVKITAGRKFTAETKAALAAKLFKPTVDKHASFLDTDTGSYHDVYIHRIRGEMAHVSYVHEEGYDDVKFTLPVDELEAPLNPDINDRFDQYAVLAGLVLTKQLNSLIIMGRGGLGKDYTMRQALAVESMVVDEDYKMIKGHITPIAMYELLEANSDKTIVISDTDETLTDPRHLNILEAVLDTYSERRVDWFTNKGNKSFIFTGSAIFLTNRDKSKIKSSLLSRSIVVDLKMTPQETIDRMRYILPTMKDGEGLTFEQKEEVLNLIDKYKYTILDLNIRTLTKALITYDKTQDIKLVRYQICNA